MKPKSLNRLAALSVSRSLILSAALSTTVAGGYAQTSPNTGTHQVTRAEVLHELEELESVGYYPSPGDIYYPADIQAAEQKLAAKHEAQRNAPMRASPADHTTPMP